MACPNKSKALKVLMGELGPTATTKMLEHCRVCGECREAFDFAASTISKTGGGARAAALGGSRRPPPDDASTPGERRMVWSDSGRRRNRRTIVVFGVALLALGFAGVTTGRPDAAGPQEPSEELFWKRSLSQGTPVVQSPSGPFEARPRVITALVPPGSGAFSVTIIDQSGRVVWQRDEKPGERGCFAEEGDVAAGTGFFRACKVVIPFPEEVNLPAGLSYGVLVGVAGGHVSASSAFQLARAGDELHHGSAESR